MYSYPYYRRGYSRQAFPYTVVTPPAGNPLFVSLDDARIYLKQSASSLPDAELTAMIKATQAAIERYTKLTLFTTEFLTKRDVFAAEIQLKKAPLQSIVSISRQVNDVQKVVDFSVYKEIDADVINYGSVVQKAGQTWPTDQDDERRTIQINFIAGFGDDSTSLPDDLIYGGLRLLADLWANRGDCPCDCAGALNSMSSDAAALLSRFRILEV
jgi:uncharacterized phiE125 gp8 family phage protein